QRAGNAIYRVGEGLTGWVAEFGQPVRTSDIREDPRWRGLHLELPADGIGAFMAVPVFGSNGRLGVLRVVRKKRKYIGISQQFTRSDQDLLQTLASQLGVALENCQLLDRVIRSERLAAWGEMSARAAHMIGNRVFAIKGSLNELNFILQPDEVDKQSVTELVGQISLGMTRLEEILQEFRDFMVATQLHTCPQEVNELIRQAVAETFPRGGAIDLELRLAPGLPMIMADPQRLHRAISELIENAVGFQLGGGALIFETRCMPANEPREIAAHLPGGELVVISIHDEGPGVPSELKQRIFTPFFSTRARGMGLGLSIVSGIIQAHRGVIREVGTPGEGAHFEIFLPSLPGSRRSE
ncbi:MAG: GAF domain-containing protein, partial [Armatimonadota bacterium]|nr:GAF domain-containing protein [Armatimonadota bacterium]